MTSRRAIGVVSEACLRRLQHPSLLTRRQLQSGSIISSKSICTATVPFIKCKPNHIQCRGQERKISSQSEVSTSLAPVIEGNAYKRDAWTNTPPSILAKLPRKLHQQEHHPISILRNLIESHFQEFEAIAPASAIVTTHMNFDELGFPADHPGRSLTDSYYLNQTHMLRTHTSAHEVETFRAGHDKWLLSADVYRRDEIDASHYPVFHQMEGARVWTQDQLKDLQALNAKMAEQLAACPLVIEDISISSESNPYQPQHDPEFAKEIAQNLKHSLNSMIFRLFGQLKAKSTEEEPLRVRWIEAFFPFTTPSYEVEVFWNGEWLEILGCGVVMQKTLNNAGVPEKLGWAFGLGLERIAMILFSIPDIRLFWSEDARFLRQFKEGQITTFKPYSKYPPCYKDLSFWLPQERNPKEGKGAKAAGGGMTGALAFHENDFCEIVRDVAGDLIESVTLVNNLVHSVNCVNGGMTQNLLHSFRRLTTSQTKRQEDKVNVID
ncbi:hypothetical protein QFC19_001384 [Naganishia cerealis]|uniref:Uncharacterized protein n=1 Tax=Naganishia cerealis TaxID=610337 RepID=A0ACC2WGG7_9TREE|nr:hypothetical protein QFC19_001384 [Naganishia cerealis]